VTTINRLLLLLLVLSFIGTANATTWWVDDSGGKDFTTIQDAVNAASSGDDICVYHGTYNEFVTVSKPSLTIRGIESGVDVVGPGASDQPVFDITADWVNVSHMRLRSSEYGPAMQLTNADNCEIVDVDAIQSYYGIKVDSSTHNLFNLCSVSDVTYYGICLTSGSSANAVKVNSLTECGRDGIFVTSSNDNIIYDNTCNGNSDHGIHLEYADNTTVEDKSLQMNVQSTTTSYKVIILAAIYTMQKTTHFRIIGCMKTRIPVYM